jgi:hypothetical protein
MMIPRSAEGIDFCESIVYEENAHMTPVEHTRQGGEASRIGVASQGMRARGKVSQQCCRYAVISDVA